MAQRILKRKLVGLGYAAALVAVVWLVTNVL